MEVIGQQAGAGQQAPTPTATTATTECIRCLSIDSIQSTRAHRQKEGHGWHDAASVGFGFGEQRDPSRRLVSLWALSSSCN